jgi:hypothetical protein
VGSDGIVVAPPVLDEHLCSTQRREDLAVEHDLKAMTAADCNRTETWFFGFPTAEAMAVTRALRNERYQALMRCGLGSCSHNSLAANFSSAA